MKTHILLLNKLIPHPVSSSTGLCTKRIIQLEGNPYNLHVPTSPRPGLVFLSHKQDFAHYRRLLKRDKRVLYSNNLKGRGGWCEYKVYLPNSGKDTYSSPKDFRP